MLLSVEDPLAVFYAVLAASEPLASVPSKRQRMEDNLVRNPELQVTNRPPEQDALPENRGPGKLGGARGWIAFVAWTVPSVFVGALLHANVLDVTGTAGRLLYGVVCGLLLLNVVLGYFLLWRAESSDGRARRRTTALRVVVGIVATLYLLFSVEALARAFPIYDSMAANPGTHFMWPEFYVPRNSLGYKDREPGPKKGPRILVLGDSFAEGAGVRRPERFSNVLEQMYRESSDPELEVYNAGQCGMDTVDETRILFATGDSIAPDVVIVAYVPNDADGRGARPTGERPSPVRLLFLGTMRSYAFYRLQCLNSPFCGGAPPVLEDPMLIQHRRDSPGWKLVSESLEKIAAWSESHSIPAVLIAMPLFTEYGERYRPVLEQVVETARARGFRARNLTDDYGGRLGELGVSVYDGHPGPEAHYLTAAALHGFVGRPWAEPRDAD